jgi:hypothetical protein
MDSVILVPGNKKQNYLVGRHTRALKMVDTVLQNHGVERWKATHALWLMNCPHALDDHLAAVKEAASLRKTAVDPKYGRTKQTLGVAYGERGNNNTNRRLLAVLPETFKDFLKKFDPINLRDPKGTEYRKHWREVYKAFPAYRVAEKI